MARVRVAEKRIWIDAESRALLHGEVHYWRLSPARWRDALRAVRELGLDVLSTYVCWEFHELEPGRFDFLGETDPRRNLVGFIELAAAEGFWLLLRPGPYIYAEWANSGVPERVLVNRDNWSMSPIDELGQPRPDLAAEFAEIVRVFREMDPSALEKLTQTAASMHVLQIGAGVTGVPGEPLLQALYLADVDYECFDVETGRIDKPLLFYAGADWLGRSSQERLRAYVEAGGTLVVHTDLPLRDEHQRPLNLLELHPPTGVLRAAYPRRLEVALGDERVICSSPTFGWYRESPGEALVAQRIAEIPVTQQGMRVHSTLEVGERYVVGYRQRRGAGSIVCLALEPSPEVILAVHRWLGVPIPSRASSSHVSTALFHRADRADFLVAVNNGEDEHETSVALSGVYRRARDLFSGREWQIGDELLLKLARKSGTVVRLGP